MEAGESFHVLLFLLFRRPRNASRQLHRHNGYFHHVGRGLERRQALQLHARPAQHAGDRRIMLAQILQHLIGDACDHRQQCQTDQNTGQPIVVQAEHTGRRRDQDRNNHHDQQKRSAAAGVHDGVLHAVFHRQLFVIFVAIDGFVLRTVIHEHALDLLHARHSGDIAKEQRDADETFQKIDQHGMTRQQMCKPRARQRRQHEKQADCQHDSQHHGAEDHNVVNLLTGNLRQPLFKLTRLLHRLFVAQHLRRAGNGVHTGHHRGQKRDHAADDGPAENFVLLGKRYNGLGIGFNFTISHAAHSNGHAVRSAHHHAFHDGLTADIYFLLFFFFLHGQLLSMGYYITIVPSMGGSAASFQKKCRLAISNLHFSCSHYMP